MDLELTTSQEINDCRDNESCIVTLSVISYSYNPNHPVIFINCQTKDEIGVVCVAFRNKHNDDYKFSYGDIIKFYNVKTANNSRQLNYVRKDLRIYDFSIVELRHSKENKHETPTRILCPIAQMSSDSEIPLELNVDVVESDSPPKVIIGTIQDPIVKEYIKNLRGVYYTTTVCLLKDSSVIKLFISEKFASWPGNLLSPHCEVSIGGKDCTYCSVAKGRIIEKGDHFDTAKQEEIETASVASFM